MQTPLCDLQHGQGWKELSASVDEAIAKLQPDYGSGLCELKVGHISTLQDEVTLHHHRHFHYLLDMCVEQELVIGNSFFKKGISKYTWIRVANGRVIERALMDYVLVTKRMVGRLKDVHVFVAAGMSDNFLVEAKVVVVKEWGNRVVRCAREVVKVEELKKPEKKQEYQDRLKETYDRVKEREAGELEEEWGLMKESFVGHASDVCGKRFIGSCMRRGSEWWNEGGREKEGI